jgi:ribonuclease HI
MVLDSCVAYNLRSSSVLFAELMGVLLAAQFSWKQGAKRLWIETDSAIALQLITKGSLLRISMAMCRALSQSRDWALVITHAYRSERDANNIAVWLAKRSHNLDLGLHVFFSPLV